MGAQLNWEKYRPLNIIDNKILFYNFSGYSANTKCCECFYFNMSYSIRNKSSLKIFLNIKIYVQKESC